MKYFTTIVKYFIAKYPTNYWWGIWQHVPGSAVYVATHHFEYCQDPGDEVAEYTRPP